MHNSSCGSLCNKNFHLNLCGNIARMAEGAGSIGDEQQQSVPGLL